MNRFFCDSFRRVSSKAVLTALLAFSPFTANAAASWYWGGVEQINLMGTDGSFQVYIVNSVIDNTCLYSRVDFKVADMSLERTKAAFALVMLAFSTGREWGVVVDLPAAGQLCKAASNAAQGAGIR